MKITIQKIDGTILSLDGYTDFVLNYPQRHEQTPLSSLPEEYAALDLIAEGRAIDKGVHRLLLPAKDIAVISGGNND